MSARSFLLLMLACCCTAAATETPVIDSTALYSHTIPVQFDGSGGLVQLRLPKEVYLHARSSTLDDLRLFDRHGRKVAFALTMPMQQGGAGHRTTPARVFALNAENQAAAGKLAIHASADGTLLSVETRPGRNGSPLAGVLIDLGPAVPEQERVTALVFTAPPDAANYSARVAVESSDDLQSWRWVAEAQLDWLSNGARDTLSNNRIAFDARAMRYVRLRWREGTPRMFGAIAAEREQVAALAYAPDTLLVAAQAGVFPGDLVYPVGRAVPLRSIGMPLAETGTVIPSEVGRYVELPAIGTHAASHWQFMPLLRTTFYRIAQENGAIRTPPDTIIAPVFVDRLVVRPLAPTSSMPPLRIGWLPATMIFAARETGPYMLAMGRDHAISAQAALSDVAPGYRAPELLAIASAQAGPALVQLAPVQDPSAAQRAGMSAAARTAVLWGVLLLGVLVLAVLSWRMARQIRLGDAAPSDTEPP